MKTTLEKLNKEVFFRKDICYSITLNPEDKYQFHGKPNRMQLFRDLINGLFISWSQYKANYFIMVELSEPREVTNGTGPRLHIHGTIRFDSNKAVKKFLLDEYYKLTRIGHIDIDKVNQPLVWHKYITKQHEVLQESPISNYMDCSTEYIMEDLYGIIPTEGGSEKDRK